MLQATVRVCRLADAARAAKRVCDSYTPWRRLRHACRSVSVAVDDDAERLHLWLDRDEGDVRGGYSGD